MGYEIEILKQKLIEERERLSPQTHTGIRNGISMVLSMIDNELPKEPVSEDSLEEAAEMFIDSLIPTEVDTVTPFAAEYVIELLNKAIKFGANWQKQQIIKRLCNHANIDQMVEKFEDK